MTNQSNVESMSLQEIREHAPARLTIKQACAILGISPATFNRWREDGKVPGIIAIGRSVKVEKAVFLDWIEDHMTGQSA
jgi:excisionase family DNA binding protein